MSNVLINILEQINTLIYTMAGDGSKLTGTLQSVMGSLYSFSLSILDNVTKPVAYTILALFFLLELYKASLKIESSGGGTQLGAEMIFRVMIKLCLCKIVIDEVPKLLNAIFGVTQHLTSKIASMSGTHTVTHSGIPNDVIAEIEDIGFLDGIFPLILLIICYLVVGVAVLLSNVIVSARFIEILLMFAVAPLPLATLPHEEMSQIGKNFLKSFTAVCLQGTLIYLVLSFFPVLMNSAFLTPSGSGLTGHIFGSMGYALVLIIAVLRTGKLSKSICNAM